MAWLPKVMSSKYFGMFRSPPPFPSCTLSQRFSSLCNSKHPPHTQLRAECLFMLQVLPVCQFESMPAVCVCVSTGLCLRRVRQIFPFNFFSKQQFFKSLQAAHFYLSPPPPQPYLGCLFVIDFKGLFIWYITKRRGMSQCLPSASPHPDGA